MPSVVELSAEYGIAASTAQKALAIFVGGIVVAALAQSLALGTVLDSLRGRRPQGPAAEG